MDDLENLKYRDLRNIAKDLGIKARGKADKLIREIRRVQGDNFSPNHIRRLSKPKPVFHSVTNISSLKTDVSSDDEITFVHNPDRQVTTDIGSFENLTNHNGTKDLKDVQEELDKLNTEHNLTVDFEDLEEAVEDKNENEEQDDGSVLDTTYEVLPDVDELEDKTTNANDSAMNKDGVNELLDVMKPEMTDEEMKAELIAAIDKKVQNKKTTTILTPNTEKKFDNCVNMVVSSKKESNVAKLPEGGKKWEKIHQKMFEKFDSIDVYLDKKNKRALRLTTPARLAKRLSKENKNISKQNCELPQSKIPKLSSVVSFIPKVISVNEVCLQFSNSSSKPPKSVKKVQATKPFSTKKVLTSSKESDSRAPFMSPTMNEKKAFSPFTFTANKNTLSSVSKKCKFDLQASLCKPISWKKHQGKLRPVAVGDVEPQYFKKGLQTSIEENRENRRKDIIKGRSSRRENLLNTRRNIQ